MSLTQIPTFVTTIESIMRTAAFARGVDDLRKGRPAALDSHNFDQGEGEDVVRAKVNAAWNYERGRHWACMAPRSMPLRIDGKLNPRALALGERMADDFI
jgi:hypothetical protein